MAGRTGKKVRDVAANAGEKLKHVPPASPNPMTNLVLTDLLLRTGGQLMRRTVEHALLQTQYDRKKAKHIIKGRSVTQTLVSTAIARMASRSVPGALIVGGGALAKVLYDRAQSRRTRQKGEKAIAEQAAAGSES